MLQDEHYIECRTCGLLLPVEKFSMERHSPGSTHRDTQCKRCNSLRYYKKKEELKKGLSNDNKS